MKQSISESTKALVLEINKVRGFNPGELMVTLDSGAEYLEHQPRLTWFWLKYPEGKISVRLVEKNDTEIIFHSRIYANRNDPETAYITEDYGSCRYDEVNPSIENKHLETAATRARVRALGAAGFNSHSADAYVTEGGPSDTPVRNDGKQDTGKKNGIPVAPASPVLVEAVKNGKEPEPAENPTDPTQVSMGDVLLQNKGPENEPQTDSASPSTAPPVSGKEPGLQDEGSSGVPEREPCEPEKTAEPANASPASEPDSNPKEEAQASDKVKSKAAAVKPAPAPGWTMSEEKPSPFVEVITEAEAGMTVGEAMALECTVISKTNPYYGMTLGQISIENAGLITWLVSRFSAKTDEAQTVVKAAKLLLSAAKGGKKAS